MAPTKFIDSFQDANARLNVLAKRKNFASRNPGVILVFCIAFLVALGIVSLFIYRWVLRKQAEKQQFETTED
ncbi:uncharacterized protein N7483_003726 [Penicillium malachiteum]|uniref:uncharacterized protein n=1 Tax=Penicillium malachiteum TaxID=1324776 RepID=UPI0025486823|nr:uncharacterized protein N7483_003726 [Penicillium malachiteum]KAJ5729218.1 hypothetical protein N7483_003726 [Penicillium malachiteum]